MINVNTLDEQQVRALARMSELGNDQVLKIIRSAMDDATAALVLADDMGRIHRLQGQVAAFKSFLDAVEGAKKVESRR